MKIVFLNSTKNRITHFNISIAVKRRKDNILLLKQVISELAKPLRQLAENVSNTRKCATK